MVSGEILTLSELLNETAASDPNDVICASAEHATWGQLAEAFRAECNRLFAYRGQRVGLAFAATRRGIARLAALQQVDADVFLFDAQLPPEIRSHWAKRFDLACVETSHDEPSGDPQPRQNARHHRGVPDTASCGSVTLLTSGTTGLPKAVQHRWSGLTRPVRIQHDVARPRWLLAFRPHLYAGLQVVFQALLNRGCLVVLAPTDSPEQISELLLKNGVQFASATPSFWRQMLMTIPERQFARVPLKQITLGGEVVDQPVLDRLHAVFPESRLVHIYATTELGRCFAVADCRMGFPAGLLESGTPDGVQLKIVDGELFVRSANSMSGYIDASMDVTAETPTPDRAAGDASTWFATGDLVEQVGDRVIFAGRRSDLINVGGNKVSPVAVEQTIRQIAEVEDVRVYPQNSSITGQLVACQIVLRAGENGEEIKQRVRSVCREKLDRYQCPQIIEVVPHLELSEAGKMVRKTSN